MTETDLINAYLDIWNERDADARESLMGSVLTDDALYSDPDYAGLRGHAVLSEAIGRAQADFGGLRFALGDVVGVHHGRALFTWRLGEAAAGYDVVEFDGDRIRSVVGFFG
ncbi:nuclear transport factor 2 family protein [Actinomadura violacea]|uniref:Nuclear transport factor 2 family protein n=1 Tax=Actinomadura violacea TaxID=2819934 RepID=A0ABS3RQ64_9ACTN|nr:nuclear transport factor 2 family protein [Actinomadura violacea]MBO2458688.1 nuclear transport factor 2 family protein [Actinomadura violacea]